jgi:hypothetical protein
VDPLCPGSQRRSSRPKLAGDRRFCSAGRPPWLGLELAIEEQGKEGDVGASGIKARGGGGGGSAMTVGGDGGLTQGAVRVPKP